MTKTPAKKPPRKPYVDPPEYLDNPYMGLLIKNEGASERRRVCIGIPMTGQVRGEWAMARWGQIIPTNWTASDIVQWMNQVTPLGYNVMDARNLIVNVALQNGFEWLLFNDSDTILPPHAFSTMNEYMLKGDVPVVCGLYFTKSDPPEPLVYRGRGNSYYRHFKIGDKFWIDGVPMGCTLIHLKLLRAMAEDAPEYMAYGSYKIKKVFDTPQVRWTDPETGATKGLTGTEDLAWSKRVIEGKYLEKAGWPKIQQRKWPFLCDSSIFCWHIREDGVKFPLRFAW